MSAIAIDTSAAAEPLGNTPSSTTTIPADHPPVSRSGDISACPHLNGRKNSNTAASANSPFLAATTATTGDLNPRNLMPDDIATRVDTSDPNAMALPTQRQISSIPKTSENASSASPVSPSASPTPGCTSATASTTTTTSDPHVKDGRWVYPSQQQFYQAMKRKNHQPDADQMAVIVPLHNAINEQAWQKILSWERKYKETCAQPTLKRFMGKPDQLSPKARLNTLLGATAPFDRHDWVVDRCGQEVTYVLDFYSGHQAPTGHSLMSVYIDVRPAVTSFQACMDRVARALNEWW